MNKAPGFVTQERWHVAKYQDASDNTSFLSLNAFSGP